MEFMIHKFVHDHFLLYNISKPMNQNIGNYIPLPISSRPLELVSTLDFLEGFLITSDGKDYFMVVEGHIH